MKDSMTGKLYLIPIPIAEGALDTIPEVVKQKSVQIKHYFVENLRTARRYLKSIDKAVDIDAIHFSEVNQKNPADTNLLKEWLEAGYEVGIMSESGCPGIADPGSILVAKAQEIGALVDPMVGPSSIFLALMASGFSGQNFRFAGYLPIKDPERTKVMHQMEEWCRQRDETQIFIETPYRNQQMLEDLIKTCSPKTKLCIAANITAPDAFIRTLTLKQWKSISTHLKMQKVPTIFLLYTN